MEFLDTLWTYVVPFVVILTIVIFVHELGHYLIARWNGVKVDVFSIGFGHEIVGWTDAKGTRWKIGWIPLGGYVKFFGDESAASDPGRGLGAMNEAERAVSFHHKRLGQRAAVVVAGPAANFLFAIVVYAALFMTFGQAFSPPVVDTVMPDSAASAAGLKPGDRFVEVDGSSVSRFAEVQQIVRMNPGRPLKMAIERDGRKLPLTITPKSTRVTDNFGRTRDIGILGVTRAGQVEYVRYDPVTSVGLAVLESWRIVALTMGYLGEVIVGERSGEDIGGPIGIARMSGEAAQVSFAAALSFVAVLSVSLGLINLFPIPLLDGGHLLFYAFEAVRGKPLGERSQEYGFRIGLAVVVSLMLYATWNDLSSIPFVVNLVNTLFS
ncbi:MAG: RIP metalloprotease RseP [Alphaproteobacteria bacterium]|nr:RIP metalloprotease RseP [Alphaproteobacteria bacterium]